MSKHLSLKKFFRISAPIALFGVASIPLSLVLTSCAPCDANLWRSVDLTNVANQTNFKSLAKSKQDFETLINGTKKVYDGNYIIIFGTNTSPNSNKFFTGKTSGKDGVEYYYNNDTIYPFNDGQFKYCLDNAAKVYNNDVQFGLFLDFDIETPADAKKNPLNQDPKAFSYKWTADDQATYTKACGDDDQDEVVENHYARNDDSAKNMRETLDFMKKLFGDKFTASDASALPYGVAWKDGKPQKFSTILTQENFQDFLNLYTDTK